MEDIKNVVATFDASTGFKTPEPAVIDSQRSGSLDIEMSPSEPLRPESLHTAGATGSSTKAVSVKKAALKPKDKKDDKKKRVIRKRMIRKKRVIRKRMIKQCRRHHHPKGKKMISKPGFQKGSRLNREPEFEQKIICNAHLEIECCCFIRDTMVS